MLEVDIYGRGNKELPKPTDGFQWLSENYKFYLAFENSNCRDYITEKVSRNALKYVSLIPPLLFFCFLRKVEVCTTDNVQRLIERK